MLSTRILTALLLIPAVLAALFLLPPRAWGMLSLLAIALAGDEWAQLASYRGVLRGLFIAGVLLIGGYLLWLPMAGFARGWPDGVVLAVCLPATLLWSLVVPYWLYTRSRVNSALGMAVLGWLMLIAAWLALTQLQARSPWLALAAMAIVWVADTAAYFVGRAFGRHKLAPAISPGKTWEGLGGALAAVALYALALLPLAAAAGYSGPISPPAVALWLALALALTGLSAVGDLFESLLKRNAGVKDSGKLLPGHGGVLDRIDALLAALPPAALATMAFLR